MVALSLSLSLTHTHRGGVKGGKQGPGPGPLQEFFFLGVKQKCELIGTKAVDICQVMRTKG